MHHAWGLKQEWFLNFVFVAKTKFLLLKISNCQKVKLPKISLL